MNFFTFVWIVFALLVLAILNFRDKKMFLSSTLSQAKYLLFQNNRLNVQDKSYQNCSKSHLFIIIKRVLKNPNQVVYPHNSIKIHYLPSVIICPS